MTGWKIWCSASPDSPRLALRHDQAFLSSNVCLPFVAVRTTLVLGDKMNIL